MKASLLTLLFFVALAHTPVLAIKNKLTTCQTNTLQARTDIQHKNIYFMLQGGIAPIYFAGQETFERKYNVRYFELGCMVPANLCIAHYNAEVGKYLDKIYGKRWRKEVRKDVSLPKS